MLPTCLHFVLQCRCTGVCVCVCLCKQPITESSPLSGDIQEAVALGQWILLESRQTHGNKNWRNLKLHLECIVHLNISSIQSNDTSKVMCLTLYNTFPILQMKGDGLTFIKKLNSLSRFRLRETPLCHCQKCNPTFCCIDAACDMLTLLLPDLLDFISRCAVCNNVFQSGVSVVTVSLMRCPEVYLPHTHKKNK